MLHEKFFAEHDVTPVWKYEEETGETVDLEAPLGI